MRTGILAAATLVCACSTPTPPDNDSGGFTTVAAPPASLSHPAGEKAGRIQGLSGRPFAVRAAPGGIGLVTEQDANAAVRFDLGTKQTTGSVSTAGDPGDVIFSPDGSLAYISSFFDGVINVVAVSSMTRVGHVNIANNAYRLAISSSGSKLFVTSTNGRIYIVNATTRHVSKYRQLAGSLQGVALSSSGNFLIVSSTGGKVWKLDAKTLETLASLNIGGSPQDVAIASDDDEVYVAAEAGFVYVLGPDLAVRTTIPVGIDAFGLAVSPDDARLYVTGPAAQKLKIISVPTRSVLKKLFLGGTPRRVAFNASGTTALVANENNWVDIIK
jgi:DNA-binding beta-propeller fold protein YncE